MTAFSTYLNLGTAVLILWYGGKLVCDSKGTVMSIGSLITFQLYWNYPDLLKSKLFFYFLLFCYFLLFFEYIFQVRDLVIMLVSAGFHSF